MATINHTQRTRLSLNVTWLAERRHIPISLLAGKILVDPGTLEKWLDPAQHGGIVVSQDQLSRLAEALGVRYMSHLYSSTPGEFKLAYASDSAPTVPARKKPGPKPGMHYKTRRGRTSGPVPPPSDRSDVSDGSAAAPVQSGPSLLQSPSPLSDPDLRRHLISLLDNPLVPFRLAVRCAYVALHPPAPAVSP